MLSSGGIRSLCSLSYSLVFAIVHFPRIIQLMVRWKNKFVAYCLLTISLIVSAGVISFATQVYKASAASSGDVIINEIMYKPGTGNENDEFIELYNTTGANIDLGGWSFSSGVTLTTMTFNPGTIINANSYLIISPDTVQTLATYGVSASASYAGSSLSNGGETITLIDNSSNVISSVSYDDVSPWPTSPDGSGPSLELKATNLDPSDPANWGASMGNGGTPLAQNSIVGLALPTIASVTDPNDITASTPVNITATVTGSGISSVTLAYKINFDADTVLTMYDDGAHNDGASGDNVYGAQIPGQAIKTLVRFKVSATNGSGTSTSPSANDSMNYHGYYIKDPSVTSNLPILEWFIADSDYNSLSASHRFDNAYVDCVLAYGNDVFDNTKVRVRGNDSRWEDKLSYKFKLPSGYSVQPTGANLAIAEFNMLGIVKHSTLAKFKTGWWVAEQADLLNPDIVQSRLNKNGEFEGAYIYADKYGSEWRQNVGLDNDELYDNGPHEVLSGAPDTTRSVQFMNDLLAFDRNDSALDDYLLDNVDLPNQINFMSTRSAIAQNDMSDIGNLVLRYNTTTHRWSSLLWDLDGSHWGVKPLLSLYDLDGNVDSYFLQKPIYQNLVFRDMYLRRLRTIVDKIYSSDSLRDTFASYQAQQLSDINLDLAKWPQALNWGSQTTYFLREPTASYASSVNWGIDKQKQIYNTFQRISHGLPASQTQTERESVSFEEVVANSNNADEYIKLSNSANTAVDLSNWTIEGINYTIPAGTVIPANGSIYILRDDVGYKASHNPVLVAGQYNNDLGNSGSLTLKTDANITIDTRNY